MSCELQLILNAFTLIKETPSRLEKDKIMKGLLKSKSVEKMLREILVYTFHPYYNFWIKLKESDVITADSIGIIHSVKNKYWSEFVEVLDLLRLREVTGNIAREKVIDKLERFPESVVNLFNQVLNRDIKIGMQLKSFEKHLGELVPKFSPMLAATWDKEDIDGEVAVEPKLDGIRCICLFPKGGVPTTVSRNGRPIYNTEHILEELKGLCTTGYVLDGELEGKKKGWGHGISGAHSKNKKVAGLKLTAFDLLTMEEWEKKKCKRPLEVRRFLLKRTLRFINPKHTEVNYAHIGEFSKQRLRLIGDEYIARGIEGIVIKPLDGTYDFKRSKNWLKYKFKEMIDCKVIGRVQGNQGTKNANKLGALIVEGKTDGQKFRSEVGQGFSDKDRKKFWKMPIDQLKQLVVEIDHYGLTGSLRLKNDKNKLPAVRNGIFLKIRTDKMER